MLNKNTLSDLDESYSVYRNTLRQPNGDLRALVYRTYNHHGTTYLEAHWAFVSKDTGYLTFTNAFLGEVKKITETQSLLENIYERGV